MQKQKDDLQQKSELLTNAGLNYGFIKRDGVDPISIKWKQEQELKKSRFKL
jgi:hypothetical protein